MTNPLSRLWPRRYSGLPHFAMWVLGIMVGFAIVVADSIHNLQVGRSPRLPPWLVAFAAGYWLGLITFRDWPRRLAWAGSSALAVWLLVGPMRSIHSLWLALIIAAVQSPLFLKTRERPWLWIFTLVSIPLLHHASGWASGEMLRFVASLHGPGFPVLTNGTAVLMLQLWGGSLITLGPLIVIGAVISWGMPLTSPSGENQPHAPADPQSTSDLETSPQLPR